MLGSKAMFCMYGLGFRSIDHRLYLLLLFWGLLVLGSVHEASDVPRREAPTYVGVALAPGDIIFRQGTGLLSRAVLYADTQSRFSHIGIVHFMGADPVVIHATPGSSLAQETKIKVEPVASFLAQPQAVAAAIYRVRQAHETVGERAAAMAHAYVLEERIFDSAFDLETEAALYCTELVWKSYLEAGLDLADGELDHLSLPLYQRKCLFPSRLQASRHLYLVANL